jgi:hypothetical protein
MKLRNVLGIFFVLFYLVVAPAIPAQQSISSEGLDRFGIPELISPEVQGSAVVIHPNAVLTAAHAIPKHTVARLYFPGHQSVAMGYWNGHTGCVDPSRDIALVFARMDEIATKVYPIGRHWTNGDGVGELVIVAGWPSGHFYSVSLLVKQIRLQVVVKGFNGELKEIEGPVYVLQRPEHNVDLPGVSGGPVLLKENGELVVEGIVIAASEGEVLAIPVREFADACMKLNKLWIP